ncbi:UNVERIFIED_CONTAM: hypothetical protein GTU68_039697 [Idotea baltica]|nr:hypothetical protein [Idotea baltica]
MGKELFGKDEDSKELYSIANKALGFDITKLCFEGPLEELSKTEIAQPAILLCSVIAYRKWQKENEGLKLEFAAGHSLGEYSALVAGEAISLEDALVLVNKRGKYMQEAVPSGKGAMLAVLGVEEAELKDACEKINGIVEIANLNAPGQIVVSGEKEPVLELKEIFPGKKLIELNVSAPFHSSLMKPAADKLAIDLDNTEIKESKFPIISNVSANYISNPDQIREALKKQVCGSVRWTESMQLALKETESLKAIEFGNGKILSGLIKRIERKFPVEQFAG